MIITINTDTITKEELIRIKQVLSKVEIDRWREELKHKDMKKHLRKMFSHTTIVNGVIKS